MRRSRTGLALVAASLALLAPTARAQPGHTTLLIGAGDGTSGLFLRDVQVRIGSLNLAQYTDSMGQARFTKIGAGTYTIEARRIGYQPITAPVVISTQDTLEVVLMMDAIPAQLDTVVVSKKARSVQLSEFDTRRQRGVGQFVTAAQIDSMPGASLTSILETHVRGVTAIGDNINGIFVKTNRQNTEHGFSAAGGAGPCLPVVYLDGVQLSDDWGKGPDLSLINIASIGGLEFYSPSQIPVQYQASGTLRPGGGRGGSSSTASSTSPSCGVMLIWTRVK